MKVTIFGAGYVGLVQAAALADVGNDVVCVDVDAAKVERLRQGEIPIFEPGLPSLVQGGLDTGRLRFTADPAEGIAHGELQFIAVGTPPDEDGSADLQYVLAVAETIGRHMGGYRIVVTKSTVPVGTADLVKERINLVLEERGCSDIDFDVASNPEFLKEGAAVIDFMKPDRIVIGSSSERAVKALRQLYAPFNRNHEKIIVMDVRSAELTKYAANCMLATKISFMNEVANLAERLGGDIEEVRRGIGSDPRIGFDFIYPGIGYGGSCFPKDVRALIRTAEDIAFEPELLKAVELRNKRQKKLLFQKISSHFDEDLSGRTFALWGLAFKPNTDDMRDAPSRDLMEALWAAGAKVRAFDPKAMSECQRIYGTRDDLILVQSQNDALKGADSLIIATEWKSFLAPDFEFIKSSLKCPVIFDGRNIYDPGMVAGYGLDYRGVGRNAART